MMRFYNPKDMDKLLKQVKEQYDLMAKSKDCAYDKLREWNRDEEIQKLTNKINELQDRKGVSYYFYENEQQEINDAIIKHRNNDCRSKVGFSYIITGTGIGSVLDLRCNCCNKIIYRTDDIC